MGNGLLIKDTFGFYLDYQYFGICKVSCLLLMTVLQSVWQSRNTREKVKLYHILESVLLQQSCVYVAPLPFCSRLDKSSNSMIVGVQETV